MISTLRLLTTKDFKTIDILRKYFKQHDDDGMKMKLVYFNIPVLPSLVLHSDGNNKQEKARYQHVLYLQKLCKPYLKHVEYDEPNCYQVDNLYHAMIKKLIHTFIDFRLGLPVHEMKRFSSHYLTLKEFAKILAKHKCSINLGKNNDDCGSILRYDYYFSVSNLDYDVDIDAECEGNFITPTGPVIDTEVQQAIFNFANTPIQSREYNKYYKVSHHYHNLRDMLFRVYSLTNGHDVTRENEYRINQENIDVYNDCIDISDKKPHITWHSNSYVPPKKQSKHSIQPKPKAHDMSFHLSSDEEEYLAWLRKVGDADGNKIYGKSDSDTLKRLLHQTMSLDAENRKSDGSNKKHNNLSFE